MKTTRSGTLVALVALGLSGSALVGCTPGFDHLEIAVDTAPPLGLSVTPEAVDIPVGIAVGITATPFDTSGEKMDAEVVLAMIPANPSVIGVETSVEPRSFVLFGTGPGTTTIGVQVDHVDRFDIPVTVKLQPNP